MPDSGPELTDRASGRADGGSPRILMFVPHGFAARNFLLTGVVEALLDHIELTVVHPLGPELAERAPRPEEIRWLDAPPFSEGAWGYIGRRSFLLGHMRTWNTEGMRHMLAENRPQGLWGRKRLADTLAWWLSRRLSTANRLRRATDRYTRRQGRRPPARAWAHILDEIQPDLVFCCDQRPPENAALVAAAQGCGVPTATFIYSWDNLSSKGRMPCEFDTYLVWSRHMAEELQRFYPHIRPDDIRITGTPQFAPHRDPALAWTREEFFQRIGGDPSRPLILYSAEDPRTDPENPKHLNELCEAVEALDLSPRPQIILRPVPGEEGGRWAAMRERRPEVIWSQPPWDRTQDAWNRVLPTREDVALLANLVRHAEVAVNVCSTITLDFAVGDKQTINIAYDVSQPPVHGIPVWDKLFRFEHYRPVVEMGGALIARSRDELKDQLRSVLTTDDAHRSGRDAVLELETDGLIEQVPERFAEVLRSLAGHGEFFGATT